VKTLEERVVVLRGEVHAKGGAVYQQGQKIRAGTVVVKATDPDMASLLGLTEKPKPSADKAKGRDE